MLSHILIVLKCSTRLFIMCGKHKFVLDFSHNMLYACYTSTKLCLCNEVLYCLVIIDKRTPYMTQDNTNVVLEMLLLNDLLNQNIIDDNIYSLALKKITKFYEQDN